MSAMAIRQRYATQKVLYLTINADDPGLPLPGTINAGQGKVCDELRGKTERTNRDRGGRREVADELVPTGRPRRSVR